MDQHIQELVLEPGAEFGIGVVGHPLVGVHQQNPFPAGQRLQGVEQCVAERRSGLPVVAGLTFVRLGDSTRQVDVDSLRRLLDPTTQQTRLGLADMDGRRRNLYPLLVQTRRCVPVPGQVHGSDLAGQFFAKGVQPAVPFGETNTVEVEHDPHPMWVMAVVEIAQQGALAAAAQSADTQHR